ncbi:unnamed protein product [Rotaria sp. Silwood1]|nr:unnamed protein product [Rotaria sp. Silwood1]
MSDPNKLFEVLASCIGPTPLPYACRMYINRSILPPSILSSEPLIQVIQTAVNERFQNQFTIDQIGILTNLIAMNISFVRNVFFRHDLAYNSVANQLYQTSLITESSFSTRLLNIHQTTNISLQSVSFGYEDQNQCFNNNPFAHESDTPEATQKCVMTLKGIKRFLIVF